MQKKSKHAHWFPLFSTNFLGVLNDNLLKSLVIFICAGWFVEENSTLIRSIATGLLVIPYIFISPLAGNIALRYPKARIISYAQLAEIPIIIVGSIGFITENIYFTMAAVLLMGIQSCFYSPAKYGIIREVGGKSQISFGTGTMEMITFVAVLLGTFFAGFLADFKLHFEGANELYWASGIMISFSILGYLTSLKIKSQYSFTDDESKEQSQKFWVFARQMFQFGKKQGRVNYVIFGLSIFWLIGALIQLNIVTYCEQIFSYEATETSVIMAGAAVAIGLGCFIAGLLSKNKVNLSLVWVGGLGMFISMLIVTILPPQEHLFIAMVMSTAFFGGLYKVPLNAWIQDRIKGEKLSEVLAFNNMSVFTFILIASGINWAVESIGGPIAVFGAVAVFAITAALVMRTKLIKAKA